MSPPTSALAAKICRALLRDATMLVVDGRGGPRRQRVGRHRVEATMQQAVARDIVQAILDGYFAGQKRRR